MEDLLQSQIKNSLRLAMPEGLRDLMTDISREVSLHCINHRLPPLPGGNLWHKLTSLEQ